MVHMTCMYVMWVVEGKRSTVHNLLSIQRNIIIIIITIITYCIYYIIFLFICVHIRQKILGKNVLLFNTCTPAEPLNFL